MSKIRLSEIKKLLQKKYRDESGKFIVEGWKSILEAVKSGVEIETVVYDETRVEQISPLEKIECIAGETISARSKDVEAISDTVNSQGIIAVLPKFSITSKISSILKKPNFIIVALDQINDPGNLGTIIRTCDWFGVDALVIGKNSVDLYNPKVVRATMGSLFHFPIFDEIDLSDMLLQCRDEKFSIYSTELSDSDDIRKITFAKKSIIIIGSESHGVSTEISKLADKKILIPQFGKGESLNAAMACGVILSHLRLK